MENDKMMCALCGQNINPDFDHDPQPYKFDDCGELIISDDQNGAFGNICDNCWTTIYTHISKQLYDSKKR